MRASPLARAEPGLGRPGRRRHQVGQDDQLDAGLAQRGQHLLDVAQEHPVGPDDEHALILQREPVRVEQVGGAMQGDDGLAGARAALHDQDAGLG
jgi:hypothetical protein